MTIRLWVLNEPWEISTESAYLREVSCEVLETSGEVFVNGGGSPRLVLPELAVDVFDSASGVRLPTASSIFTLEGESFISYALPSISKPSRHSFEDYSVLISFRCNGHKFSFTITQSKSPSRPLIEETLEKENKKEGSINDVLASFIDWQVNNFQELLDVNNTPEIWDSITRVGIIRRTWALSRSVWLGEDDSEDKDPAQMALIVHLADDKKLRKSLETICRNPRKILEKYRKKTNVDRVDQLDVVCLLAYVRRPGRNLIEKAGPKQEILSVQRRQSADTLENRLSKWVISKLIAMCKKYLFENRRHKTSSRVRSVNCFAKFLDEILKDGLIEGLRSEGSVPIPNYALQYEYRYHLVWKAYRKIIKNLKILDDAWRWQRVLWEESCRQIIFSVLTSAHPPAGLNAIMQSTPYYRTEQERGRWAESPLAPGPFSIRANDDTIVSIFDCREEGVPRRIKEVLGTLGCTQVFQITNGHRVVLLPVWFVQQWGSACSLKELAGSCCEAATNYIGAGLSRILMGLLIVNAQDALDVEIEEIDNGKGKLVALQLPTCIYNNSQLIGDFVAGIEVALDVGISRTEANNYSIEEANV